MAIGQSKNSRKVTNRVVGAVEDKVNRVTDVVEDAVGTAADTTK